MISKEDRELIRKFENIRQRGYYCNSRQLQELYNRVFNVNKPATQCSSCMRQRIGELMKALIKEEEQEAQEASKIAQDEPKQEDLATTKEEKNNAPETKKRGRPKVKKEE